jgi:hypothetical protein
MTDTATCRFTAEQLSAMIEVLDDTLAGRHSPLAPHSGDTVTARLQTMYLEHARGRLRSALGSLRAGAPDPTEDEIARQRIAAPFGVAGSHLKHFLETSPAWDEFVEAWRPVIEERERTQPVWNDGA